MVDPLNIINQAIKLESLPKAEAYYPNSNEQGYKKDEQ